jgi:fructosamine-3-kinase
MTWSPRANLQKLATIRLFGSNSWRETWACFEALKRTRRAHNQDPQKTRQIKEGADLSVKLVDRLQSRQPGPGSLK